MAKFDFSNIDINKIDPDKIDIGTRQQDCALIAQTYERGAHSTPTEAAVFATLSRNIQNNKQVATYAMDTVKSYFNSPVETAENAVKQAENLSGDLSQSSGKGVISTADNIFQALNIGDTKNITNNEKTFGENLLKFAKDCIPCDLRIASFLELNPNVDLLSSFENFLKNKLALLSQVADMLNNVNMYGDFCTFLSLLNFMCIPDLQRIISLLMAMFTIQIPKLDLSIGLIQGLIAPIFAPILMGLASLFNKFTALVVDPLKCVQRAIDAQLKKISVETDYFAIKANLIKDNPLSEVSTGLTELNKLMQEGIKEVTQRLKSYTTQIDVLIGELGSGDASYVVGKLRTLQLVRMMMFIQAIMSAILKGHNVCAKNKTPEKSEIDNFFNNFLNPNSPFNLWVDEEGQVHVDEKVQGFDVVINPPNTSNPLPEFGNVLQFEGEDILTEDIAASVSNIVNKLSTTQHTVSPCKLELETDSVDKVNSLVEELKKL